MNTGKWSDTNSETSHSSYTKYKQSWNAVRPVKIVGPIFIICNIKLFVNLYIDIQKLIYAGQDQKHILGIR